MTTYIPKNMADLQDYIIKQQIEKTVELANETLNNIVLECFKAHMNSDFYEKYKEKIYPRSYQMREKIGVKLDPVIKGNSVTFGVYFDENRLEESYWSNKGYEGIRYNENGYMPETIMQDILTGNFDIHRNKDVIEMVKVDIEMLNNIKKSLLDGLKEKGFIVK